MTKDLAKKFGVCDLEYAKELRDLGYKQEGLWWWIKGKLRPDDWVETQYGLAKQQNYFLKMEEVVAPTVAELGERLPSPYHIIQKVFRKWTTKIIHKDREIFIEENTEANARAKILIYLIKNKYIKL